MVWVMAIYNGKQRVHHGGRMCYVSHSIHPCRQHAIIANVTYATLVQGGAVGTISEKSSTLGELGNSSDTSILLIEKILHDLVLCLWRDGMGSLFSLLC